MKQVLHLCSKIRGLFSASQCSDVGYDCRLTVVRPSFDCRSTVLKLCSILVIVLTVGVGYAWGAVVSGTSYSTTTASQITDNDWSYNGSFSTAASPYIILNSTSNYIQTNSFCVSSFSSIILNARTYGGPDSDQKVITVDWVTASGTTTLGTLSPSGTTLANCTISSPASITANKEGYIKIYCGSASSNKGSGVASVTISYTSGSCTPAAKYTVSFSTGTGNPSVDARKEASAGAGIILPDVTPACSSDGWALYGWATSAVASSTTTAPTIVGKAGDTYKPSDDITLYAVYAKGEYTKITSTSSIDDGGKYLIVASYSSNNYIMTNKVTTDTYGDWLNGVILAETSTNKYHAASVNAAWVCTFTESSSKYYIQNASGGYIDTYYSSSDWYSHTPIDASDKYTITYSSGTFSIVNSYGSEKHLDFYSDGTFGPNDKSYGLLLYEAGTISYYSSPTCCTQLGTINGSFLWTAYFIARKPFCRAALAALYLPSN